MMPDRIGIIGSTHGVNASSSPKPKNAASSAQLAPSPNRRWMACSSYRSNVDDVPGVVPPAPAATPRSSPATDTVSSLSIGG